MTRIERNLRINSRSHGHMVPFICLARQLLARQGLGCQFVVVGIGHDSIISPEINDCPSQWRHEPQSLLVLDAARLGIRLPNNAYQWFAPFLLAYHHSALAQTRNIIISADLKNESFFQLIAHDEHDSSSFCPVGGVMLPVHDSSVTKRKW
jgi:hypothetical protein